MAIRDKRCLECEKVIYGNRLYCSIPCRELGRERRKKNRKAIQIIEEACNK